MSEKKTVYERWSAVMNDLRELQKSDRNDFHKFMFRGIDAVMNATGSPFRKHGVMVIPTPVELRESTASSNGGKLTQIIRVQMKYTVYGADGDSFEGGAFGEANDLADKATAKAQSVAFRTFLLQSLTLPTHDTDPDQEGEALEQTKQKPQWAVQIDSQSTAEQVEALIHGWKQKDNVPENVQAYANRRIAQLRK